MPHDLTEKLADRYNREAHAYRELGLLGIAGLGLVHELANVPDQRIIDLGSLAPLNREACLAEARRRMEGLDREGFIARRRIVYEVARA